MFKRWNSLSFKVKLSIGLLLIVVMTPVTTLLVNLIYLRDYQVKSNRDELVIETESQAKSMIRIYDQQVMRVVLLSHSNELKVDELFDDESRERYANEQLLGLFESFLQEWQDSYKDVVITDHQNRDIFRVYREDGRFILDTESRPTRHRDLVSSAYIQRSFTNEPAPAYTEYDKALPNDLSGGIWVACPIKASNGENLGVISVLMRLEPLFEAASPERDIDQMILIDEDGSRIYDSTGEYGSFGLQRPIDYANIIKQNQGSLLNSSEKPDSIIAYQQLELGSRQWVLINERPKTEATMEASQGGRVVLLASAVTFAVAVILLLLYVRSMMLPLKQLAYLAGQIAKGNWDVELPQIQTHDELGQLTRSFGEMASELSKSYHELQQKVSALSDSETELNENRQLMESLIVNAQAMIYVKSVNGKYLLLKVPGNDINQTAERDQEIEFSDLLGDEAQAQMSKHDDTVLESREPQITEDWLDMRNGLRLYMTARFPLYDAENKLYAVGAVAMDITDRKLAQQRLEQLNRQLVYQSRHDDLTGLANRASLRERLKDLLNHRGVCSPAQAAFLFMDLNNFKSVNDSLGHLVGDDLLVAVSRRIDDVLRSRGVVARIAGDEFAFVLYYMHSNEDVLYLMKQLLRVFEKPFQVGEHGIYTGASFGVVQNLIHYDDPDTLLRDADTAMYAAKKARQDYAIFDQQMHELAVEQFELTRLLREAVKNQQLLCHVQPIINVNTDQIVAGEVLLRWMHPEKGTINPDRFMNLSGESGMSLEIGDWVIDEAMRIYSSWMQMGIVHPSFKLSINVSPAQVQYGHLSQFMSQKLEHWKLDATSFRLELLEDEILFTQECVIEELKVLRSMGFEIWVDDFGTGYSSLARLVEMPFDGVKIDRQFLQDISNNEMRQGVLKSIKELADCMKLQLAVEGVEDQVTLDIVKEAGANLIQGFYFSHPVECERFEFMLSSGRCGGVGRGRRYTE